MNKILVGVGVAVAASAYAVYRWRKSWGLTGWGGPGSSSEPQGPSVTIRVCVPAIGSESSQLDAVCLTATGRDDLRQQVLAAPVAFDIGRMRFREVAPNVFMGIDKNRWGRFPVVSQTANGWLGQVVRARTGETVPAYLSPTREVAAIHAVQATRTGFGRNPDAADGELWYSDPPMGLVDVDGLTVPEELYRGFWMPHDGVWFYVVLKNEAQGVWTRVYYPHDNHGSVVFQQPEPISGNVWLDPNPRTREQLVRDAVAYWASKLPSTELTNTPYLTVASDPVRG